MTAGLIQRAVALAAVALLAAVAALAVNSRRDAPPATSTLPERVPVPGGGWYHATAAVRHGQAGRRTSCGIVVTAATAGVGDPVLPCGSKLYLGFGEREVLTQVIDLGAAAASYRFELTPALAKELGLTGLQPIRWAFARAPRSGRVAAVLDPVRGAASS